MHLSRHMTLKSIEQCLLLQKGLPLIQHLPNLLPDGFWRLKVNSHHCRRLGEQLPCSQQAEGPPPGSAAASSAASASARPADVTAAASSAPSARPADVTPPWHRQDANPSAAAREPSATAEECADRWHEEVVKRSNWLTLQDALAPQFRMFDPVMFLAWKTS